MKASDYIYEMTEARDLAQMTAVYVEYMDECNILDDLDADGVISARQNKHYQTLIDICPRLQQIIVDRYGFRHGLMVVIESLRTPTDA